MMDNNQDRRSFLKAAALGSLGVFALSRSSFGKILETRGNYPAVGIQLYTVRDAMNANVKDALTQVAKIGYKNLELAGYGNGKFYGMEPTEFKKLVDDLGMTVISSHSGVEVKGVDTSNAEKMAEDHAKLGVKYLIQPWMVEARRKSADSYKQFVSELNLVGEVVKKHGMQFGYHNHNFEFTQVDGLVPYTDIFLKEADPSHVIFEMDIYWVTKAGFNPIDLFNKYPGRFQLWHVKDMEKSADQFFAPVGTGSIDYTELFKYKDKAGMKYFFVEQDNTRDKKPFDAIQTSYDNLTKKILK